MSEYSHFEKPFHNQLAALDWSVTDQGYVTSMHDKASEGTIRISVPIWKVNDDA